MGLPEVLHKLSRLFLAGFALVASPFVRLGALLLSTALAIPIAAVIILIVSFVVGAKTFELVPSYVASALVAAGTAAVLTLLAAAITPVVLFFALCEVIISPIKGARAAWEGGLEGWYDYAFRLFFFSFFSSSDAPEAMDEDLIQRRFQYADADQMQQLLSMLQAAQENTYTNPIEPQQFAALELSQEELNEIIKNSAPLLTPQETQQLAQKDSREIADLLQKYQDMLERLNGNCTIDLEKPAPENAVVLVKQYFKDSAWLPVPGRSQIFNKQSLQTYCTSANATHPLTRENLLEPTPYKVDTETYHTRYVFHNYYYSPQASSPTIISQEISMMAAKLRDCLTTSPKPAQVTIHSGSQQAMFTPANI
ncbi:hypothetical protein NKV53_02200 [Legionella sp. 27cVA30]|uniref:Coiled coil protein n=1 Tax=Legionella septentrionalis TaxID=2498109 RepID=A0A3S0XT57_9GAMM|nr:MULTISPECIES: hypothetical protein [Legionella]MCP0913185.1 hypothetical protein [Legionella sp. 27cVA30]RUQ88054.1 hypothetical protein EKM59_06295 [Legionella septentrionalis]RUR17091.1 hypothetical protein ELY10_01725 [Legionella septentrionalis]